MKTIRIPYSQLVSILVDHKERQHENEEESPFSVANDALLSTAAGEFLKSFIESQQRHNVNHRPDPFTKMLDTVGFKISKMRSDAVDELVSDMDDLLLRVTNFAGALVAPIESSLAWCIKTAVIDDNAEEVIVTTGQDYRIGMYYSLRKEIADIQTPLVVKVPRKIAEVADLEDVEQTFNGIVDSIFRQVDSDAVRLELKERFITYLNEKN